MQAEYSLDRKSHADPAKIREFLKKVRYPLCFLDFETFGSGIPLFDGTRPYQQVPFQYSLHRIDAEGEEARHFEYLAQPGVDPRKEIAERLVDEIPFGACVIAYNMAFEKRVLRELGRSIPKLRKRLNAVIEGMIDLMEPFKRRDIYDWRMNGSYSLKSVLPVLVPGMTYKGLEISDGAMASEAYFTMETITDPAELSQGCARHCWNTANRTPWGSSVCWRRCGPWRRRMAKGRRNGKGRRGCAPGITSTVSIASGGKE